MVKFTLPGTLNGETARIVTLPNVVILDIWPKNRMLVSLYLDQATAITIAQALLKAAEDCKG